MTDRMMSYLPKYYQKSQLTRQVQQGISSELISIDQLLDYIILAFNVVTADEKAIARYEYIVDLRAGNYTLEQRRERVLVKLRGYETSTVEVIERVASRFLGVLVTAIEVNDQYYFYLEFERTVDDPGDIDAMREAIEEIKPAHLGWGYRDTLVLPKAERQIWAAGAIYQPVVDTILPEYQRPYMGDLRARAAITFNTITTTVLPTVGEGG